MIVKVQISQFTTCENPQMLVYDEHKTLKYQGDATAEVLIKMKGLPKQFFHSEIKNGERILLNIAPWQNW